MSPADAKMLKEFAETFLKAADDEHWTTTGTEYSVRRHIMRETPLAILAVIREREELLAALRAVEWMGEGGFWESAACPSCGAEKLKNWELGDWHEQGCKLRAAIRAAEGAA